MCLKKKAKLRRSFRGQLILALLVVSVLPILFMQLFSFYQIENVMRESTNELVEANMTSTMRGIALTLDAYESVLNQLYTDDTVVSLISKLNAGEEVPLATNQLMRVLRAGCYAKDYIQGITIIQQDGTMVFYDKLTGSTIRNAWMEQGDIEPKTLLEQVSGDNKLHLLPTQFATQIGTEQIYLFHMARRIIDYKDIDKRLGIVVLSIDERLLNNLLSERQAAVGYNFIVDRDGRVISSPLKEFMGRRLQDPLAECSQVAREKEQISDRDLQTYNKVDNTLHWQLISVVDQEGTFGRIQNQQRLYLTLLLVTLFVLLVVIVMATGQLSASVKKIAEAMRRAGAGDMNARVAPDGRMTVETASIADQFNLMMGDIEQLIAEVKTASKKRRDAEIAMLEAQINPHFLYNTLDTINWMAIDESQFEISNAISSLARILRYSVDRSNQSVTVREEADWLVQYLSLQQMRLKNNFQFTLEISEGAMNQTIHKLMFQPFVENAIQHGFAGLKREPLVTIKIDNEQRSLRISICDNGRGISPDQLSVIRHAIESHQEQRDKIGILNAVSRLRMYYGEDVKIDIDSELDQGTRVGIWIRFPAEGGAFPCASSS